MEKPTQVEEFPEVGSCLGFLIEPSAPSPLPEAHLQQIHTNMVSQKHKLEIPWTSSDLPVTSFSLPTTSPRPPTPPTTTSRPRSPSLASRRRTTRTTRASERTARSSLSGTKLQLVELRQMSCLGTSRPRGGRAGVRSPREADATGRTTARAPGGRGALIISFLRVRWQ